MKDNLGFYEKIKLLTGFVSVFAFFAAGSILAGSEPIKLNIESQKLATALLELGDAAGVEIVVPQSISSESRQVKIQGDYGLEQALQFMLAESGLSYHFTSETTVVVTEGGDASDAAENKRRKDRSGKSSEIEEMVVTAQKREQSIKDVPISIVSFGSEELEERNIDDLVKLSVAVPGMVVQDNGTSKEIYMRGVGNVSGLPMVGIYLDDIPVTGYSSQTHIDTRIFDLERVEVLRGPQGTLYGEGSMSGSLRFITKSPQLDEFGGMAKISASYTQDGSPGHKTQGVINIPLVENTLAMRIAGTIENSGGWIDQPAIGRKNINNQDVVNIRVKTLWQPSDATSIGLTTIVHRNEAGAHNQSEDEDGNFAQTFGLTSTPSWDDDYELHNLTLTRDFDSISFTSSSSYMDARQLQSSSGRRFQLSPPPAPVLDYHRFSNDRETTAFSQEVRLTSVGSGPFQWTAGVFYRDIKGSRLSSFMIGVYEPGDPLPDAFGLVSTSSSESWAVFGNAGYEVNDRLEIGAGLRYFKDDRGAFNGTVRQEDSFDSVTPRFYLNYDISNEIKVYGSIAKGFRSGGFNTVGSPSYGPDSMWTYELGTKMTAMDGEVDAELAFYYSEYTDLQLLGIAPPPAPPVDDISNGGEAEIKGVDLSVGWHATDDFRLEAKGSVVQSEVVKLRVSNSPFILGDRLDSVPKYSFTLSAILNFEIDGKAGFGRLDYSQRGKTLWTSRDIWPGFMGSSGVNNMLGGRLELQWNDNISIGLFGENLLNDRDLISPYAFTGFSARNRPRTVGVEFGFDFQ